jgi:Fic family protein
MKVLINNDELMKQVEQELASSQNIMNDETLMSWFTDDFSVRFCWSSNALEGNTLSLEETVDLVEHDVVSDGHTYTEHQEAKNLYCAIRESMIPFRKQPISEEWIKHNNRTIRGFGGEYRTEDVKVGTIIETTYRPPEANLVPGLMQKYVATVNFEVDGVADLIEKVVRSHLHFERIHPFYDGNGRTGRMIMNQQLINHGLLPIAINKNSEYRQSFKRYDKNGDISQLVHVVLHGELQAIQRLQEFKKKREQGLPLDLKQSLEERIEAARAVYEAQGPHKSNSIKREERD